MEEDRLSVSVLAPAALDEAMVVEVDVVYMAISLDLVTNSFE